MMFHIFNILVFDELQETFLFAMLFDVFQNVYFWHYMEISKGQCRNCPGTFMTLNKKKSQNFKNK